MVGVHLGANSYLLGPPSPTLIELMDVWATWRELQLREITQIMPKLHGGGRGVEPWAQLLGF